MVLAAVVAVVGLFQEAVLLLPVLAVLAAQAVFAFIAGNKQKMY